MSTCRSNQSLASCWMKVVSQRTCKFQILQFCFRSQRTIVCESCRYRWLGVEGRAANAHIELPTEPWRKTKNRQYPWLWRSRKGANNHRACPFYYHSRRSRTEKWQLLEQASFKVPGLSSNMCKEVCVCWGGGASHTQDTKQFSDMRKEVHEFNSISTLSTQTWHRVSQGKGSVLQDCPLSPHQMPVTSPRLLPVLLTNWLQIGCSSDFLLRFH